MTVIEDAVEVPTDVLGQENAYAYVGDNPINRVDPLGLAAATTMAPATSTAPAKIDWSKWDFRTAKYEPHGTFEASLTGVAGERLISHMDIKFFPDEKLKGNAKAMPAIPCGATEIRFVQIVSGQDIYNYGIAARISEMKPQIDVSSKGYYNKESPFYYEQEPWTSTGKKDFAQMWDKPHPYNWAGAKPIGLSMYTRDFTVLAVAYSGPYQGTIVGVMFWKFSFFIGDNDTVTRSVNGNLQNGKIGAAMTITEARIESPSDGGFLGTRY